VEGLVALVQRAITLARQGSAFEAVPVLNRVSREKAFFIAEQSYRLPGVSVDQVPVREYVYGELTSHVLGFMGPIPAAQAEDFAARGYANPNESVGLSGLEYQYQDELRGIPGQEVNEVDILGRIQRQVEDPVPPVPGENLILSLDIRLQRVMQSALLESMRAQNAESAVAIAVNPKTGEILGMVSLPTFDNNDFAEGLGEEYVALERDPNKPLINYAIGGLYPPGSTYKIVSASAALEEGIITGRTEIIDNGPLYLPNRFFPNDLSQAQEFVSWNHRLGINHGRMNVVNALALSNDIFFYWIGGGYLEIFPGLGDKLLAKWTQLFGFGETTGIDLPGEVAADIPDDQWKRQIWAETWVTGDSYNLSIGQGYLLATPLEVLMSFVPVITDGILYEPRLVHQIVDADGALVQDFEPVVKRQVPLQTNTLGLIRDGLWSVVNTNYGTAPNARIDGLTVAGKTGTAEFCDWIPEEQDCRRDKDDNLPTHAWYVGYGPYDDPEIAVVAFVYDGGEGSEAAVPVVTEVIRTYLKDLRPDLAQ
jgi:penicillin-binding protein 2